MHAKRAVCGSSRLPSKRQLSRFLQYPSTGLHARPQVPQSSLRLLARAAMTPLGVFNDHIDYKALLRRMD